MARQLSVVAPGSVQYYLNHIGQYEREFKTWEQRAEKIVKRYKDGDRDRVRGEGVRFNVLWSNVQTLKASTFSRMPKPDVSRRFKDNDPVGRVAAMMLERALEFEVDHYPDFHDTIKHGVYDRFLGGRGTAWVRYEPKLETVESEPTEQITEDIEPAKEELVFECAPTDYVHWKDFGHSIARTWEEVGIVWRKVYFRSKEAIAERFGEEMAARIPLDSSPSDKTAKTDPDGVTSCALIYEIWDKERGTALWLSKSLHEIIEEVEDPLGLEEFFPCPRPLYATVTNDSLIPVPDFVLYQDQANQLDVLADRINGLVRALMVRGVYDASSPELARLFKEGSNTELLPVKNWAAFAEKQGLRGAVDMVDLTPIANALVNTYQAFEQTKAQIYEISGISDIVRGNTAPEETATAQQIKGQYASLRLKQYQDEVAMFATHMLQMKAEIICKHFDDSTIVQMSGAMQFNPVDQQYVPMALQLLRNDPMRTFRIEIAADSMLYMDEQQEKQDRMEFLNATSQFIEKLVQAGQVAPEVMGLGVEMLKFGVTGFRVGKGLEGVIDQVADQIKQQALQPKPQQPNPDMIKAQADQQKQQMQLQHEQQLDQVDKQHQIALEQMKSQAEDQRTQFKAQIDQQKSQMQAELDEHRMQHEAALQAQQQEFDRWKTTFENSVKVLVAQISAKAALDQTALAAQQAASEEVAEDIGGDDATEDKTSELMEMHGKTLDAIKGVMEQLAKPKSVVRDANGRVIGVQ